MAHISLFSRFAIEVLVIGLGILSGMMDDAIPMIRRRIERIEFQWNTAGIDDIVIRSRPGQLPRSRPHENSTRRRSRSNRHIHIGNPSNMKALLPAEMASIKQFAFSLNPLVLLEKQIAIPLLHFKSPVVSLRRGADGKNN